jgi:predicted nucleic acid binding AN1-type Zn finger protein
VKVLGIRCEIREDHEIQRTAQRNYARSNLAPSIAKNTNYFSLRAYARKPSAMPIEIALAVGLSMRMKYQKNLHEMLY